VRGKSRKGVQPVKRAVKGVGGRVEACSTVARGEIRGGSVIKGEKVSGNPGRSLLAEKKMTSDILCFWSSSDVGWGGGGRDRFDKWAKNLCRGRKKSEASTIRGDKGLFGDSKWEGKERGRIVTSKNL